GLPLLRRLDEVGGLFGVAGVLGPEDVGHARAVLALDLVAAVGPALALLAGPQEDAAVLPRLHPAHLELQDEVGVLPVRPQPAAAAVQLDDAVLRHELRPVHDVPAVQALA